MTFEITEADEQPLEVRLSAQHGFECSYWHSPSQVRSAIAKIYRTDSWYIFMRTSANPQADALIREHHAGQRPARFTPSLLDTYRSAVQQLSEGLPVASYPLIKTSGVHNSDRREDWIHWPVIHIIRDSVNAEAFRQILNGLHTDKSYATIAAIESPQNYNMAQVELLREHRVEPLIIHERQTSMTGSSMNAALDFLCQDTYHYESRAPRMDSD